MRWNTKLHPSLFPLDFAQTTIMAAARSEPIPLEREFSTRAEAEAYAERFRLWRACLRERSNQPGIRCVDLEQSHRITATIESTGGEPPGYYIRITARPRIAAIAALALGIDANPV